jgi:hypothetical protein
MASAAPILDLLGLGIEHADGIAGVFANQRRFCSSTAPRRGREFGIGAAIDRELPVLASSWPMFEDWKSSR